MVNYSLFNPAHSGDLAKRSLLGEEESDAQQPSSPLLMRRLISVIAGAVKFGIKSFSFISSATKKNALFILKKSLNALFKKNPMATNKKNPP
jgi:hypothetical protein